MNERETYIKALVELLSRWMSMHVTKIGPRIYNVACNTHNLDGAIEAISTRFPPPPYPPKWDHAVPAVVRAAARQLLTRK